MFDTLNLAALRLLAAVPNPGGGAAPPGAEKLETILKWATWLGYGLCVLGVIIAATGMALQVRRGTGGMEAGAHLGWVLAGALIIGSASALVGQMA